MSDDTTVYVLRNELHVARDSLDRLMEERKELKRERDEALEKNTELGKMYLDAVSASQGHEMEAAMLEVQRDAARAQVAALQDAIGTDDEIEAYIHSLQWGPGTTDLERTLVAGNIRAFHGWIKDRAGGDAT